MKMCWASMSVKECALCSGPQLYQLIYFVCFWFGLGRVSGIWCVPKTCCNTWAKPAKHTGPIAAAWRSNCWLQTLLEDVNINTTKKIAEETVWIQNASKIPPAGSPWWSIQGEEKRNKVGAFLSQVTTLSRMFITTELWSHTTSFFKKWSRAWCTMTQW